MAGWKPYQSRYATEGELIRWFNANQNDIAVVTGKISNLAVVDCDGVEGISTCDRLNLNAAVEIKTRSGGRHLWFQFPTTGLSNSVKKLPGIDMRGEGGYVLVPPSPGYEMYKNLGQLTEFPLAVFPQQVVEQKRNAPGWIAEELAKLSPGYHQNPFTKIIGKLHHDRWGQQDIREFLTPFCVQENFSLDELETIIQSITKRAQGVVEFAPISSQALLAQKAVSLWVVEGLLPQKTITILGGLPGACKTWLALDLAVELTRPKPRCFGYLSGRTTKTLYIDEESSPAKLAERLNLLIADKPDVCLDSVHWLVGSSFDFNDNVKVDKLKSVLYTNNVELVIVDSLNCVNRYEENSATELSKFFQVIKNLVREFDVSFLFIDHEGKDVHIKEKEGTEPRAEDLRGSNVKSSSCDQVFNVRKHGELVTFYNTKSRWAERIAPVRFSLVKTEKGVKLEWII